MYRIIRILIFIYALDRWMLADSVQVDCLNYANDYQVLQSIGDILIDPPPNIPLHHESYAKFRKNMTVDMLNIVGQESIPHTLLCLKTLRYLSIQNMPVNFNHIGSSIHALIIENSTLIHFASQLKRFTQLESLTLSNTNLRYLPDTFRQLSALRYLSLANNHLESLPDSISQLYYLKELNLDNNPTLKSIEFIDGLSSLIRLHANHGSLTRLPTNLDHIENLYLGHNKFTELTGIEHLGKKSDKQKLFHFNNNQIRSIPPEIRLIKNLYRLDLDQNRLKMLPTYLKEVRSLRFLLIKGNPITQSSLRNTIRYFEEEFRELKIKT